MTTSLYKKVCMSQVVPVPVEGLHKLVRHQGCCSLLPTDFLLYIAYEKIDAVHLWKKSIFKGTTQLTKIKSI